MSRIMALDFGTRRTGVAVTDPLQLIASGLTTVETPELLGFLKEYLKEENLECLVLGQPKQMDDSASESEPKIRKFIEKLKKEFPELRIERVDERFTSKLALQSMIDGGMKKNKRRDKSKIDEISATLILQNYMATKS
jgi:putative Holliday junction resolvase